MRRVLAGLVVLALLNGGCATMLQAIQQTPDRVDMALTDPIRKEHVSTQVSLELSTAGVAIGCIVMMAPTVIGLAVCPMVALAYNFLMYEFILEPLSKDRTHQGKPSLVGPYWERGPRDGEEFIHP